MPPLLSFQTALQLPAYEAGSQPPLDTRTATGCTLGSEHDAEWTRAADARVAGSRLSNFIRVMGQICLTPGDARTAVQINNPYHNACRTLQHMLVQSYSSLYTCDQVWLRGLIDSCDASTVPALRLLSCKIVSSLLTLIAASNALTCAHNDDGTWESDEPSPPKDSSVPEPEIITSIIVGGHSLVETTIKLLKACCDADHQIRGQAVAAFGQYSPGHWRLLRKNGEFLSLRSDCCHDCSGVDTSVRAAVLQCLIVACGDHVGTVRTAAQKSLGEAIVTGGLVVRGQGPDAPRRIFIIDGSNAVKERQAQAQQVQAEALAKAMAQAQAQAIAQSQTPAQRVAQITLLQKGIAAPDPIKGARSIQRRSHQIDKSIKHDLPTPQQRTDDEIRVGDACVNSVAHGEYTDIILAVLQCLQDGCADSKLAVRLQATWALGNLLLLILPLRQKETFSPFSASFALASVSLAAPSPSNVWTSDRMWFGLCDISMCLLEDSDKLLASTVRCLGFLAAGLSPWDGTHFSHLSAVVTALIQKVLLSGLTTQQDRDQYLKQSIQEHPHKLVFSVCQSLGFVGWVLVNRGDKDAGGVTPGVTECIDNVRAVQAAMLRYGRIKVQLQACKALISLTHNDEGAQDSLPASFLDPVHTGFSETDDGALRGYFSSTQNPFSSSSSSSSPSSSSSAEGQHAFPFSAGGSAIDGGLLNDSVLALGRRLPEGSHRDHTRPDSLLRALEAALVTTATLSEAVDKSPPTPTVLGAPLSTLIGAKHPVGVSMSSGALSSRALLRIRPEDGAPAAAVPAARGPSLPSSVPNIIVVSNINAAIMPAVRTGSLQRALLVLIWVMLRRVIATYVQADPAARQGGSRADDRLAREAVTQILLYHADALGEWLESMLLDAAPLNTEELSMTAPPLASTAPPLTLLSDASPKSIVPLIAECFQHIMQTDSRPLSYDPNTCTFVPHQSPVSSAATHLTSSTATKFAWLSSGGSSPSAKKTAAAAASSFSSPPRHADDDDPHARSAGEDESDDDEL